MIPESIGVEYSVNVPLELAAARDGHAIVVPYNEASAPVKLTGSPREIMTVFARKTDMTFKIGGPTVQATRASNAVPRGAQVPYELPAANVCSHISFFGLDAEGEAIVNFYRRGT